MQSRFVYAALLLLLVGLVGWAQASSLQTQLLRSPGVPTAVVLSTLRLGVAVVVNSATFSQQAVTTIQSYQLISIGFYGNVSGLSATALLGVYSNAPSPSLLSTGQFSASTTANPARASAIPPPLTSYEIPISPPLTLSLNASITYQIALFANGLNISAQNTSSLVLSVGTPNPTGNSMPSTLSLAPFSTYGIQYYFVVSCTYLPIDAQPAATYGPVLPSYGVQKNLYPFVPSVFIASATLSMPTIAVLLVSMLLAFAMSW